MQNLLVDSNFRTKVADFGLSGTKGIVGSPPWMAPEILRGEKATTAADVYSFAIVMYELYSRKDPYEGDLMPPSCFDAHLHVTYEYVCCHWSTLGYCA